MDIIAKTKELVKPLIPWGMCYRRDLFLALCMVLVGGIGYNLGRMNALEAPPAAQDQAAALSSAAGSAPTAHPAATKPKPSDPRVVASKTSKSKLYHYTYCPGAGQIKDTNKLWFDSAAAAEAAGYTLAGNCKP